MVDFKQVREAIHRVHEGWPTNEEMVENIKRFALLLTEGPKETDMTKRVVILYSGGLDSRLLLHWAIDLDYDPYALLIDYGQRHVRELQTAKEQCQILSVPWRVAKVQLPGIHSGLTGSLVPGTYKGVHEMHVPGRNVIFVGLAVSLAEQEGIGKIWYGPNYEDRINLFPDCYQDWVYKMNQVLACTASIPIELEAPLLGMRKETIVALAEKAGIDLQEVHSGYDV